MPVEHSRALPAAVVAGGFAVLARVLRSVTDGGAILGAGIAFLFMNAAGLTGFVPILVVFLLTWLATRWRAERKRNAGVAEGAGGRRASQVLANLGAAGLCALAATMFPGQLELLMAGAMAALAEAAADTVSSEVGQGSATQPLLILGLARAPVGTNGAISVEGTLAGCIAASIVAWAGAFSNIMPLRWSPVIALAGTAGMLFDSFLGAAFENKGLMGNDAVNFVSTIFAADFALLAILASRIGR
jgi:uncharacterized protein (TIGR00297 family)